MPFTPEKAEEIKNQLLKQVESSDMENKEQIKGYVQGLDEEQLEEFLKKNNIEVGSLTSQDSGDSSSADSTSPAAPSSPAASQCIFCSIIKGEIPSYKIAENKKAIATLEINPVSKGHSIIIPINHSSIEKLSKSALSLAQKIAKKIKKKLKAEDVKIETSSFQGHAIINVIPFYKDAKLEKKKATEEELKQLQSTLAAKKRSARSSKAAKEVPKESLKDLPKISFRIP